MHRLKQKYGDKSAVIIMGGPSIIENGYDLSRIDRGKHTVFLESKALTPLFLKYGLSPDYYLMFFPQKCQTNAFQQIVYQSFLADVDLEKLLNPEYLAEYSYLKDHFAEYFEIWNPKKGPHKKFRLKSGIELKNSPFELIDKFPDMGIITRYMEKDEFGIGNLPNEKYYFDETQANTEYSQERYFNPEEKEGKVILNNYNHMNSAAIALFPILAYMGFANVYLIGMDMSMLGSMEYSALYCFKSMRHFKKFFKKARQVYNAKFIPNKRYFLRPLYEFEDFSKILCYDRIKFKNIYEQFEYAAPIEGIENITFKEFVNRT